MLDLDALETLDAAFGSDVSGVRVAIEGLYQGAQSTPAYDRDMAAPACPHLARMATK